MKPGLWVVLLSILVFSCKHEPELVVENNNGNNSGNNPNNNPDTTYNPPPVDTMVCFESEILPLFVSNCAMPDCHDAISHVEGVRLYDYTTIRSEVFPGNPTAGDVMDEIIDGDMPEPPYPLLTSEQIALLQRWINQGAQNTTNCAGCDSTQYTFAANVLPIVQTYCTGCHSGTYPSGGIPLTNYTTIQASAADGGLVGTMNHLSGYSPMPKNAPIMSACERAVVRRWVQAGMQNN